MKNFKLLKSSLILATLLTTQFSMAAETDNKTLADESSYAIGVLLSENVKHELANEKDILGFSNEQLIAGFKDALAGKPKFDQNKIASVLEQRGKFVAEKQQEKQLKIAKLNAKDGEKFRADFAKQKGVVALPSGTLYKITEAGDQKVKPTKADKVKVNYKGTFIDGKTFDSSYDRGEPVEFVLGQLIPAWGEAIPLLGKGGKMTIVAPPKQAYGEAGSGPIAPNSTLVFDIELLDVVNAETKVEDKAEAKK